MLERTRRRQAGELGPGFRICLVAVAIFVIVDGTVRAVTVDTSAWVPVVGAAAILLAIVRGGIQ